MTPTGQQRQQRLSVQKPFEGKKLLWCYWDTGEENMPQFCKLALQTWRCQNPTWTIIVVSEHNKRDYICEASDLPATYESLIVQHRSDLIRLAVLIRHGGVYLDATTLICRGLDAIWDDPDCPNLLFVVDTLDKKSPLCNAFIFARKPNDPLLKEWLKRANTCFQGQDMPENNRGPSYSKSMKLHYFIVMNIQNQLVFEEPELECYCKQHVRLLPDSKWGFLTPSTKYLSIPGFKLSNDLHRQNDNALVDKLSKCRCLIKFSSVDPFLSMVMEKKIGWWMEQKSTIADVIRSLIDETKKHPQATLSCATCPMLEK